MRSTPLSVRLTAEEREALAARAGSTPESTYVRKLIRRDAGLDDDPSDERLDTIERRLARLEGIAGL